MASTKVLFLVIFGLINQSLQSLDNNEIDEDINLYKDAAKDIRKEQLAENIGSLFQNVLDNQGDNILGGVLSQLGKENSGQLLQGLSSLLAAGQGDRNKKDSDGPNILDSLGGIMSSLQENGNGRGAGTAALLQGLGSLLGQGQQGGEGNQAANLLQGLGSLLNQGGEGGGNQGDGTAALLQGLGSLLGQGGNQDGQGGINPELIGTMINLFANQDKTKEVPEVKRTESSKETKLKKVDKKQKKAKNNDDFDMGDLLSLAGSFLGSGNQKGKKSQDLNFMTYLPTILQTINTFIGPEADKRAKSHESHAWLLPPFLEKIHIFFDNFIHSDIGKNTIAALGAEKAFKVFLDDKGRFDYKKFGELMENHSYRRQWIRIVTDRIANFLQYVSEPKVYKSYLLSGQILFNTYLMNQGFPQAAYFDPSRPVETLTAFVNYAAKKYGDLQINAKEYVKPAVLYVKDILKLAEKSGTVRSLSDSKELSNKLADTINLEIIEPLARVNRAFRFSKNTPSCDRYVLCLVNEKNQNEIESLPGLKKMLYKGSSLAAGWFLSARTGTPFLTYYKDITREGDCKKLYNDKCEGFHVEEMKVTTEYVHNEL